MKVIELQDADHPHLIILKFLGCSQNFEPLRKQFMKVIELQDFATTRVFVAEFRGWAHGQVGRKRPLEAAEAADYLRV
jgi:hypothetical protein